MTRTDQEFDEYGKRVLAPLRPVPSKDPHVTIEAKKQYLLHGENLRQGLSSQPVGIDKRQQPGVFGKFQSRPMMKALMAVLLAVLVVLSVSSITAYAAQSSLPGEPLYAIKSLSEDVRLSMTFSTKSKLDLTLDYTNRRMDEISSLLAKGKPLNDQTSDRFQRELENVLQLAAQLDDIQIQNALWQIRSHAENQGMTIEELINKLPPQAEPAIVHLQARLTEQVQLSTFGETDPKAFRVQIRERHQKQNNPKHSSDTDKTASTPSGLTGTPMPEQNDNDNGNKMHQPTEVPGQVNPGNGKGQSTPGNGNHGPSESSTPKP